MEIPTNYEQPLYAISVAARILKVSVHTLRMYEREGLIIPYKKESNHRLYSQSDIDRLSCIRKAINEYKISINGIKAIYSLIPCWEITGCNKEEKQNCKAYNSHAQPCWTFVHEGNDCKNKECRICEVYTTFTDCRSVKEGITTILERKVSQDKIPVL